MNQHELRIELLKHQSHIHRTHCLPCDRQNSYSINACSGCIHINDLRLVGEGLMISKRNPDQSLEYLKMLNGETARKIVKKNDKSIAPYNKLTIAKYQELTGRGLSDKEIAIEMEIDRSTITRFKRKHGLVGNRPTSPKKVVKG